MFLNKKKLYRIIPNIREIPDSFATSIIRETLQFLFLLIKKYDFLIIFLFHVVFIFQKYF
jgi:hypothetical protein